MADGIRRRARLLCVNLQYDAVGVERNGRRNLANIRPRSTVTISTRKQQEYCWLNQPELIMIFFKIYCIYCLSSIPQHEQERGRPIGSLRLDRRSIHPRHPNKRADDLFYSIRENIFSFVFVSRTENVVCVTLA